MNQSIPHPVLPNRSPAALPHQAQQYSTPPFDTDWHALRKARARSIRYPLWQSTAAFLLSAAVLLDAGAQTLSGIAQDFKKAAAEGKPAHLLEIDNDSLLLKRDDGFYTSGLRYTRHYTMGNASQRTAFGWRIGQEQYTASNINLPPALVSPLDHPYAGWLYGGIFKTLHRADGSAERFGIDIGCLGPCAGGEWVQSTLHRMFNQPLPRGWNSQLKNEAGLVLYAERAPVRWRIGSSIDITPDLHGRFGNIFTDAGGGVTLRAGRLNLLPDQPTLHAYLRFDGRAVGYNATLQGGYFSSGNPHTVTPKRLVGEAEVGLVWNRAPYAVSMAVVRRGNEIQNLSNAIGAQNFARLQFSYTP